MGQELSAEELLEELVIQDELAAKSTDRPDATVRDAKWKLDALAAALRTPASPVPFEDESDCQRVTELIAALGTSEIATYVNPDLGEIGQYQLLEKLGQGGMGTVYKAMHTRLEKVVALKVLRTDRISDSSSVTRFEREMKAVGRLDHPNIVRALDANEDQGTHYLVMEYVDGRNLAELVRSRGPISVPNACELIRQAALALQEAHQQGLVHRDIKPSNLMLTSGGQVKLLDLGLARLHEFERDLTMTGQVMGTLDYIAPEQVGDSHDVDTRADLYSLGATLYKLLTGFAPFEGQQHLSPLAKLSAMATEPIVPVKDRRSDVPAELSDLVEQMLSADPNIRPQSASEVAAALAAFTAGNNLTELVSEAGSPSVKPQAGSTKNLHSEVHDTGSAVEPSLAAVSASMLPSVAEPPSSEVGGSRAVGAPSPSPVDSRNQLSRAWSRRPPFAAAAVGGIAAIVLLLFGVVYVLQINQTRIVVEITDPAVEAVLKDAGLEVRDTDTGRMWKITTADAETRKTIEPGTGNFRAEVAEDSRLALQITDDGGAEIIGNEFTLKRGQTVRIRVALLETPPPFLGDSKTQPEPGPAPDPKPNQPDPPNPRPLPVPLPSPAVAGDVIPGLIPRPAPIDGVRRWQIETRAPRHEVTAVAFHRDGELVAYGTKAGHVRIYDAETMQLKHWLPGRVSEVRSLEWSRNGEWLAAASNHHDEGTVQFWRTDGSYGPTMRFGIFIEDLSWKSDSSQLAVVGGDNLLSVNPQGKILSVFRVDAPRQVAWSPDDEWLAIGTPGTVQLLKDDGSRGPSFEIPEHDCANLSWNSDGTQITCIVDRQLHVLHIDGTTGLTLTDDQHRSVTWHPTANLFAIGFPERVRIIEDSGTELQTLDLQRQDVFAIAWSGDGSRIAWGSSQGGIGIWNWETGQLQTPAVEFRHHAETLAWHPNGQQFAVSGGHISDSRRLRVWNADGSPHVVLRKSGMYSSATWSSDGRLAYNGDLGLEIWDANDNSFSVLTPRQSRCIAWSPDGSELAISDDKDLTVSIWSPEIDRNRVLEGRHSGGYIHDVCFSSKGEIASVDDDGTIRIWNPDGSPQRSLACDHRPNRLAWSPDRSKLAAGGHDIHLWNTQDFSERMFEYSGNPGPWSLDWRHDGQILASGHAGEIRIWNPNGTLIKELRGHKNSQVPSVAWQPRSSKLLSIGRDNTIILWNTETAVPEWIAVDLNDAGTATFGPDGQLLHGDPATVDAAFVYLVETDDGARLQLRHSEFVQKFAFRKDSSTIETEAPQIIHEGSADVDDPDRRAAEWALGRKYAAVAVDIAPDDILDRTALPSQPFKVTRLGINDSNLTDSELKQLSGLTYLTALDLRECPRVTWSAIEGLQAPQLLDLGLAASTLRHGGFQRLAVLFPKLAQLSIRGATQTDFPELQQPPNLTSLSLHANDLSILSSEGVKHFEGWELKDFSIYQYLITDDAFAALSTLELHSITISNCEGFTKRGVEHLRNARRLVSLSINSRIVTDDWLETLRRFDALEYLGVRETHMTPAAVADLQRSLPNCRVESQFTPEELQAHAPEERGSNEEASPSAEGADTESLQERD